MANNDPYDLLVGVLGSNNVYFQPPESVKMSYPAIVYSRNDIGNSFANNNVYAQNHSYEVVVIDRAARSKIVDAVSKLPKCRYVRNYKADNLNHDVFILYY